MPPANRKYALRDQFPHICATLHRAVANSAVFRERERRAAKARALVSSSSRKPFRSLAFLDCDINLNYSTVYTSP